MTLAQLLQSLAAALDVVQPDSEVVIVYDSETCYTDAVRVDASGTTVSIVGGVEETPAMSDEDEIIRFAAKQQAETTRQMIKEWRE